MKLFDKLLLSLTIISVGLSCLANDWNNNLRDKFLNNETIIMEINIRSFNADDENNDGFIQKNLGETSGNFLNATERLDEIKNLGINTLHVLPITPTGKLKALGTAGSLYAASSFNTINPDIIDKNSKLTPIEQAKYFVDEAHKRGIYIILDVPACASYDLYLERPDLFVTSQSGEPVIPSDWTDVRLLAAGNEDKINQNVYSLYKDFVKLALNIGADGIRADVAHSKPAIFWKELINYSRKKNPQFLWLAESSESWHDAISPQAVFTPYNKLLEAGFDGYYGSFFNIKDWKNAKDLYSQVAFTLNETKKYSKSVIGSFTTHDQVSPILLKGEKLSEMIIWLNSTLPVNSYYVDGFQWGDDYYYPMGNKFAENTDTDDDIYFYHRGQIDIFNLSRKPGGNNINLRNNLILGNNVKSSILPVLNGGNFTPIKINNKNSKSFAYYFENNKKIVLVCANIDFDNKDKITLKIPKYNKKAQIIPIKISSMPEIRNGKMNLNLEAGEIVVFIINY